VPVGHAMAAGQRRGGTAFTLALGRHSSARHGMAGVMVPLVTPIILVLGDLLLPPGIRRFGGSGRAGGGILGGGNRLVSGSFRHVRLLGWEFTHFGFGA
jgi:hypothetical protein